MKKIFGGFTFYISQHFVYNFYHPEFSLEDSMSEFEQKLIIFVLKHITSSYIYINYINQCFIRILATVKSRIGTCEKNYDYRHFIEWHISKNSSWKQSYVYIINRIIHRLLEIWNFSSCVQIDISLVRYWFDQSKINPISQHIHVLFSLYIHTYIYMFLLNGSDFRSDSSLSSVSYDHRMTTLIRQLQRMNGKF